MKLLSLQLASAIDIAPQGTDAWWDKEWRTGFFKQTTTEKQWLGYEGLRGDEQADRRYHGGVDKAVCVYPSEHYSFWRATLGLPGLPPGAFGENFTTEGLIEELVCIGDIYAVGEAIVEVSQPRQPCWKLARRWRIKDLAAQVERTGRTGFYFRVLRHGAVQSGDRFSLQKQPNPEWTIQRCNEIMHHLKDGRDLARELSACTQLSGSWKDSLYARAIHDI
jgi:MOSC domain-containing protein YiiM